MLKSGTIFLRGVIQRSIVFNLSRYGSSYVSKVESYFSPSPWAKNLLSLHKYVILSVLTYAYVSFCTLQDENFHSRDLKLVNFMTYNCISYIYKQKRNPARVFY